MSLGLLPLALAVFALDAHAGPAIPKTQDPGSPGVVIPPSGGTLPKVPGKDWHPPYLVKVEGPDAPKPGQAVRLRVVVERELVDATPMAFSVRLPDGVSLLGGQLEESVVDATSAVVVRELELQVGSSLPEDDVVITVRQLGEGWGANAVKAYRFGRPDPAAKTAPLRFGKPVDVGHGKVVRPVIVD